MISSRPAAVALLLLLSGCAGSGLGAGAERAVIEAAGGPAHVVTASSPFTFVMQPRGVFSPMYAVTATHDGARAVSINLRLHDASTIAAETRPLESRADTYLVTLRSDYQAGSSGTHVTGYAVLEVGHDGPRYLCGWPGDRTHEEDPPMSGTPSRFVSVRALPEGNGFLVTTEEENRSFEGHQAEETVRYTVEGDGCSTETLSFESNDPDVSR